MPKNLTKNCIWRITYNDGKVIWEKDPNTGKEFLFKDIDLEKVKYVDLMNPVEEIDDLLREEVKTRIRNSRNEVIELVFKTYNSEVVPLFHLELEDWQRLVIFRRQLKKNGQYFAVLGDVDMLDDKKRAEYEKNNNVSVKKPQTIPYPMERSNETIFLIGWQSTIGGKNVKSICMVYPDGHVEMKPDR